MSTYLVYILFDQNAEGFYDIYPDGMDSIFLDENQTIWFYARNGQLYFDLVGMLVDKEDSSVTKGFFQHIDINDTTSSYTIPSGYMFMGKVYVHDPAGSYANASIRIGTTDGYGEWSYGGGG